MSTQPRLPDAEQDVLASLYALGEGTARDVREHLEPKRPLAHASVVTLLTRLEERGLVTRRKAERGKAFVFTPTRAKSRAFGPLVQGIVKRAFGGNSTALVAALFANKPPTSEEVDEMEKMIAEWRDRQSEGKPR